MGGGGVGGGGMRGGGDAGGAAQRGWSAAAARCKVSPLTKAVRLFGAAAAGAAAAAASAAARTLSVAPRPSLSIKSMGTASPVMVRASTAREASQMPLVWLSTVWPTLKPGASAPTSWFMRKDLPER